MRYGYTVADEADTQVFHDTVNFMKEKLGFVEDGPCIEDVDGSVRQKMFAGSDTIEIESDRQINYVAIISSTPLRISCLKKWIG